MTALEIYAYFLSPVAVGAVCAFMFWLTGRQHRKGADRA
jgi:hypothetical protein